MTRPSRRELENALDNLDRDPDSSTSDLEQGVTAPFVTYQWGETRDGDASAEFVTIDEGGES
jgi:hypothetical protein